MGFMKIDKGILQSYLMGGVLVALVGTAFILMYIWSIVGGSIFYVVENNSLPVTSGTETFLGETETSFFENLGYVKTGLGIAGALIAVAFVLMVFAGFIMMGKGYYKKIKSGSGKGDMGY